MSRGTLRARTLCCRIVGLSVALASELAPAQTYVVTVVAGTPGRGGFVDGKVGAARFWSPDSIAVDAAGNVYVADTGNHVVRRISADGEVVTVAGQAGGRGASDGAGSAARFHYPHGIAVDPAGRIYVADTFNHTVRRMTPDGVVTTVAGLAGSRGGLDGHGQEARFAYPFGIAVDRFGRIYIGDEKNCAIRRITPDGTVSTIAGRLGICGSDDGPGADARFNEPRGVAVDAEGTIFVADTNNHTIRRITPLNLVSTVAGQTRIRGHADGPARAARFYHPLGVAIGDDGTVYVADTSNSTIRAIAPLGTVRTLAGQARTAGRRDGAAATALFDHPVGIARDVAGDLYVADYRNHAIRKISKARAAVRPTSTTGPPPLHSNVTSTSADQAMPEGVHSVQGECVGRIALTPTQLRGGEGKGHPLVYDCRTKSFELLKLGMPAEMTSVGDLTPSAGGYYVAAFSGPVRSPSTAGYFFFDVGGKPARALRRPDLSPRDLVAREQSLTYVKRVPDRDAARCGRAVPAEVEIITEDLGGKVIWSWSSKGHLASGERPAIRDGAERSREAPSGNWLSSARNCWTAIARKALRFETPKWFVGSAFPLLDLDVVDPFEVNSIQWVEPAGDILVSAGLFNAVFLIDRQTGTIKWSFDGATTTATSNRPADPKSSFSHQQSARIAGNRLWLLDSGNVAGNRPSRVISYAVDPFRGASPLLFEFLEPNGRHRSDLGSVQILASGDVLIGWGGLKPQDHNEPQRAVSIVRASDGAELFSMDLSPGWASDRAKALQP